MPRRIVSLSAIPAAIAAVTVAVPALAGTGQARPAHIAAASHCLTVRVGGRRVRECLIAGPTGTRGPVGPAGARGATGEAGRRGSAGAKGSRGAAGPAGSRGATGTIGPAGPAGATGPAGLQGPVGAGGRAYAVVDPSAVGSTASVSGLVSGQSSGFRSVRSPASGVYCLAPAPGIDPASEPAMVSGESGYSTAGAVPLAVLNATRSACSAGEFQVTTYDARSPSAPSATIAFAILAP